MNFIGVDLHKKSITICVMDEKRKVLARKTLACTQTNEIVEFFRQFRPFKVVVEATASYPWFVELVEPLAEKVVLANPKKLRVIAESTKKTDNLDAQVLTEFLVLDMIPESYQPTPRLRQHRASVRHRQYLQGPITSVRSKIRHILSNYNADRKDLFSANCGPAYFKEVRLSDVDRFVMQQLWSEWQDHVAQRQAEAREILKTAPEVGPVTAEVVLSELGDVSRFRNAKTCLRLRRTGAGGTAERGEEVQGHEDHQGRLGTLAVGTGGDSLAAGRQKPEMGCPVLSVDASQRQEAGHRGGGQEAALRALRHAQDVDSVPDRNHADHGPPDNWQGVGQDIDSGPDHDHGDDGSPDNWQEVGQDIDSGPDHNHVTGRTVPEQEGRARANRTKSL